MKELRVDRILKGNPRLAKSRCKNLIGKVSLQQLKVFAQQYQFSIALGDVVWLDVAGT